MFKIEVEVPYPRADWAEFVVVSLKTDKELNDKVQKTLEVHDKVLKVTFEGTDPKMLRTCVFSFFDFLKLTTSSLQYCSV